MDGKSRKTGLCRKCRFHGQQHIYRGGHARLCQFRDCSCELCKKYDVARNTINDLNAHVQNLEGNLNVGKQEPKFEVDVKLEVKKEPEEYFSSDEENSLHAGTDAVLDMSRDHENVTRNYILNQSEEDPNFSDEVEKITQSNEENFRKGTRAESSEVCPYCESNLAESLKDHVSKCSTAKKFEMSENLDIDMYLDSDSQDSEMPDELDFPSPGTSATEPPVEAVHCKMKVSPPLMQELQCPICSLNFSKSPQKLELHAETCHVPGDARICFVCDKDFTSSTSDMEFQIHVENHFGETNLQENCAELNIVRTDNHKKRKVEDQVLSEGSSSKHSKQSPEVNKSCIVQASKIKSPRASNQDQIRDIKPNTSQRTDYIQLKQSPGTNRAKLGDNSSQIKQSTGLRISQNEKSPGPISTQYKQPSGPCLPQIRPAQNKQSLGPSPTQIKQSPGSSPTQNKKSPGPSPAQNKKSPGPRPAQNMQSSGPSRVKNKQSPGPRTAQNKHSPGMSSSQDKQSPAPCKQTHGSSPSQSHEADHYRQEKVHKETEEERRIRKEKERSYGEEERRGKEEERRIIKEKERLGKTIESGEEWWNRKEKDCKDREIEIDDVSRIRKDKERKTDHITNAQKQNCNRAEPPEVCPYCESVLLETMLNHVTKCSTAQQFLALENSDLYQSKQSSGPGQLHQKENSTQLPPEVSKAHDQQQPQAGSSQSSRESVKPYSEPDLINQKSQAHQSLQSDHIRGLISRFDQNCSKPDVLQIFVPATMVGLIIGQKGWFIKKVIEDTGVNVSVDSRNPQMPGPVSVTMAGPSVNLPTALAMIEVKLGHRIKGFVDKRP